MIRESDGSLFEVADCCTGVLRVEETRDGDGDGLAFAMDAGCVILERVILEPDDARELGERLIEWARLHGA